jgi:hypothetical protein
MYSLSGAVDTLTHGDLLILQSCSQVFTILLVWLLRVVENIPREQCDFGV